MNEETKDWKIASNTELKEECERLKKIFEEKQEEMKTLVEKMDCSLFIYLLFNLSPTVLSKVVITRSHPHIISCTTYWNC